MTGGFNRLAKISKFGGVSLSGDVSVPEGFSVSEGVCGSGVYC